jgi:hypothetical protein
LIERVLPGLRQTYGEPIPIDLVTCYPGAPAGIDAVHRVGTIADPTDAASFIAR